MDNTEEHERDTGSDTPTCDTQTEDADNVQEHEQGILQYNTISVCQRCGATG